MVLQFHLLTTQINVADTTCLLFILWCYCDFSLIAFYAGQFQQVCGSFSVWEQFLWEFPGDD